MRLIMWIMYGLVFILGFAYLTGGQQHMQEVAHQIYDMAELGFVKLSHFLLG